MSESPALPVLSEPLRGCGKCCMRIGRPPFSVEQSAVPQPERVRLKRRELPAGMPAHLIEEVEQYVTDVVHLRTVDRRAADMPCSWLDLDTMLCKHYEFRPKVCRECDCAESELDCLFC